MQKTVTFLLCLASFSLSLAMELKVAGCKIDKDQLCIYWGKEEFPFAPRNTYAKNYGFIGKHYPGAYETIYVRYFPPGMQKPTIIIFDPNRKKIVEKMEIPSGFDHNSTYFSMLTDSQGKKYPFIAPGQHYTENKDQQWWEMTLFSPVKTQKIDLKFKVGGKSAEKLTAFRHNGGWLHDVDGDGWQDIHLPYMRYIHIISGKTGKTLSINKLDVAKSSEPNSPEWFHSGRFYGSFTPFKNKTNETRTLVMAGNSVGTFEDPYCNVSRYLSVLKYNPKNEVEIDWANYVSFSKSTYKYGSKTYSPEAIGRKGDYMNKCIHRASDSVFEIEGRKVAVYSLFESDPVEDDCELINFDAWFNSFPKEKMDKTYECTKKHWLRVKGMWKVQIVDLETGKLLKEIPNSYFWGTDREKTGEKNQSFILEHLDEKVRFDQQEHPTRKYQFYKPSLGDWKLLREEISDSKPVLTNKEFPIEGEKGTSSFIAFPEMEFEDKNGDGILEIVFEKNKEREPQQNSQRRSSTTH